MQTMKEYMCKSCGRTFPRWNTAQTKCGLCQLNTQKKSKKQKPLKVRGKQYKQWAKTRRKWIERNPPNHQGFYTCALCHQAVHIDELAVDHIIPRSRDVTKRHDLNNLQPAHHSCNNAKGSRVT